MDVFLVKFNATGSRLWGTYYGGGDQDETRGYATDNQGNVYIAGFTLSPTGIASGGFDNTHSGGNFPSDAFLTKINDPILSCPKPKSLLTNNITAVIARLNWSAAAGAVGYQYELRKKGTTNWSTAQATAISKIVTGLKASTIYQWRVITACQLSPDTITSNGYANGPEFTTLAAAFASSDNNDPLDLKTTANDNVLSALVYPNPANKTTTINISNAAGLVQIVLTDLSGKQIWVSNKTTDKNIPIDLSKLTGGTYMAIVKDDINTKTLKLIKE